MRLARTERFKRAYTALPLDVQSRVDRALRVLLRDPTYPGLRVRRVLGLAKGNRVFEARVNGGRRITFNWEGDDIILRNVGPHDITSRAP